MLCLLGLVYIDAFKTASWLLAAGLSWSFDHSPGPIIIYPITLHLGHWSPVIWSPPGGLLDRHTILLM